MIEVYVRLYNFCIGVKMCIIQSEDFPHMSTLWRSSVTKFESEIGY